MKIIPYTQLGNKRSISDLRMMSIFNKIKELDLVKTVFSGGNIKTPEQFLWFVKRPINLVHIVAEGDSCVATGWLNKWGHNSGYCHFCMFPEIWGKRTLEAGLLSLSYWFSLEVDGKPMLDVILSKTSAKNDHVNRFAERIGWHLTGTVPGIFKDYYNNCYHDAIFRYIERKDILYEKNTH